MRKSPPTDFELVQLYLKGSEPAFNQLLLRHKDPVFTYIYMTIKDEYIAEDYFQETFIKAINQLRAGEYRDENKFQAWIIRIAHNRCMDHFRKLKQKKSNPPLYGEDLLNTLSIDEIPIDEHLDIMSNETKIRALIEFLPEEQKETVMLRLFFDFNFQEIADFTNVNINTTLGRMRYAVKKIRKLIVDNEVELVRIAS